MKKKQSTKDDWNANLYDQNHSFVSKYGNNLIELLAPKQGEKFLTLVVEQEIWQRNYMMLV